ncbi:hypothetical protein Tco_1084294 [Tanacetum coccineum]
MMHGLDQLIERKEGGGMYLLWVPLIRDVRTLMMDETHASRYLVHPGTDKTYYDLRDMYGSHKEVVHFGKKGKLALRIRPVAYRLRLPKELSEMHDTLHVSNLKKCLADANLHVSLEEIKVDKTLHFVEEPAEIIHREVESLKRSKIPIVMSIGTRSEVIRIS